MTSFMIKLSKMNDKEEIFSAFTTFFSNIKMLN
jgi:hypothetical protein